MIMIFIVSINFPEPRQRLALQFRKHFHRPGSVVHVRSRDGYSQQQPQTIHDNMAFSTVDVFGVVPSDGLTTRTGINRLAVDTRGAGRMVGLVPTDPVSQHIVNALERAVMAPLIKVAPNGAFWRKLLGQVAPLAASTNEVKDGVQDITHRGFAGATAGVKWD